jgi:N-acetylglucosamine-6-phosphate deacetylase
VDFSSPSLTGDDVERVGAALLERGTVGFLATVITSPPAIYARNLPLLAQCMRRSRLRGRLLGVHLEGPFISPEPGAVGVHPAEWVQAATADALGALLDLGDGAVRLITVAADSPGILGLIAEATRRGVVVSLGHHLATAGHIERAVAAGARAVTHLGNGLPDLVHRHHNPLWPALANDGLLAMVIADGHHVPPDLLKVVARAKGEHGWIAVSDAAPLAGMPPGEYAWGAERVVLEPSGKLMSATRGCFAGSAAHLDICVRYLGGLGFSAEQLTLAALYNPLRLLGVSERDLRPDKGVHLRAGATDGEI